MQTPYPGTRLHAQMEAAGRITTRDWDLYDTRHAVYRPARLTPRELEAGYHRAYREFYGWRNIARGAWSHPSAKHRAKHFAYAAGWKKFEPLWDFAIKSRRLDLMTPLLEAVLSRVTGGETEAVPANTDTSALGAVTSIQGDKSRSVYPIFPNFK